MSCCILIIASGGVDSGHGGAVDLAIVVVVTSGGTGTVVPSLCHCRCRLWWCGHGCHQRPIVVVVAARIVSPSLVWRALRHIVIVVIVASVRWHDWARGRHKEWVAQIEWAARVRIGQVKGA